MGQFYRSGTSRFLKDFVYQPDYATELKLAQSELINKRLRKQAVKGFDFINTFQGWQQDADAIVNEVNAKQIDPLVEKLMKDPNNPEHLAELKRVAREVKTRFNSGDLGDMRRKYETFSVANTNALENIKKIKDVNQKAAMQNRYNKWYQAQLNNVGDEYNEGYSPTALQNYFDAQKDFKDNIDLEGLKYKTEKFRRKEPFVIIKGKPVFQSEWSSKGLLFEGNQVIDKDGNKYDIKKDLKMNHLFSLGLPRQYAEMYDTVEGYRQGSILNTAVQRLANNDAFKSMVQQDFLEFGGKAAYKKAHPNLKDDELFSNYFADRIKQEASLFASQYAPVTNSKEEKKLYKDNVRLKGSGGSGKGSGSSSDGILPTSIESVTVNKDKLKPDILTDLLFKELSGKQLTPIQLKELKKAKGNFKAVLDTYNTDQLKEITDAYEYLQNKPEYHRATYENGKLAVDLTEKEREENTKLRAEIVKQQDILNSFENNLQQYADNFATEQVYNIHWTSLPATVGKGKYRTPEAKAAADYAFPRINPALTHGKFEVLDNSSQLYDSDFGHRTLSPEASKTAEVISGNNIEELAVKGSIAFNKVKNKDLVVKFKLKKEYTKQIDPEAENGKEIVVSFGNNVDFDMSEFLGNSNLDIITKGDMTQIGNADARNLVNNLKISLKSNTEKAINEGRSTDYVSSSAYTLDKNHSIFVQHNPNGTYTIFDAAKRRPIYFGGKIYSNQITEGQLESALKGIKEKQIQNSLTNP